MTKLKNPFSSVAERLGKKDSPAASEATTAETVEMTLQMPASMWGDMKELANIAGHNGHVDALLQDVIRVYEQVIRQETENKRLAAVPQNELGKMPGDSEIYPPLIAPGRLKQARRFFEARNSQERSFDSGPQ